MGHGEPVVHHDVVGLIKVSASDDGVEALMAVDEEGVRAHTSPSVFVLPAIYDFQDTKRDIINNFLTFSIPPSVTGAGIPITSSITFPPIMETARHYQPLPPLLYNYYNCYQ